MNKDVIKDRFLYSGKSRSQVYEDVKLITWELQHNLVVVDVDTQQRKKTEWKSEGRKRNVAKLRDEPCRQICESRVKEVMSDNNHDLWGSSKESVLLACDEVCGHKKNRECNVDTWWWNSWVTGEMQKRHIKK